MLKAILSLVACISVCEGVGAAGMVFTDGSVSLWYRKLKKPLFNPPGSVFGPVWTLLYALMGTAFSIVANDDCGAKKRLPLIAFVVQLALNFFWTVLFFGKRSPFAALIEIVTLWAAILLTILLFWRISKPASLLLAPYLAWVTFAAVLNYFIWKLNKKK